MLLRRKMLKLLLGVSLCVFTLPCLATADDQDDSAFLLYCDDEIRNFSLASGTDSLLMSGIARPQVVDYDIKRGVFFWIDYHSKINKAPLWQEGARPSVLRRDVISYGLAVDWVHNLIYFTEYKNEAIGVSRLDGSMVRTILKEDSILPLAIALNPAEGFMFWSDRGAFRKIERLNMDGTNREVIVTNNIKPVYSLAIDLESQRIFWVDRGMNHLCSSKFDGSDIRILITQLTVPTSIDIYGQLVYFITSGSGHPTVYKASKVDGSGFTKVFDGKSSLNSLKVFHPSKQIESYDVCGDDNGGCSHLCLPASNHSFSCACPNDLNMDSDNHTCLYFDGSPATTPSSTTNAPSSQSPFTVFYYGLPRYTGSPGTTPSSTTNAPSSQLPWFFIVPRDTDPAVTTPILTTNAPPSQMPFAVTQTSSSTESNVDATVGSSSTYGIFTAVIASVTLIAVVGMWIYNRKFLTRIVANTAIPNPVQRRNCEENNLYMEASL